MTNVLHIVHLIFSGVAVALGVFFIGFYLGERSEQRERGPRGD